MKSIKLKYIALVFLIAIAGCRKDERIDGPVINEPIGDPTIEVISGVTGLVTDENGKAISNAAVNIYNRQAKSDENGIFYVNNVGLKKTNSPIRIEKEGYFDGFKSFIPALGKKSYVAVQLVEKGQAAKIQSSSGGVVNINGGAKLTLPANGLVEKDGGAVYNGDVNVYTHWYDPLDDDLGLRMPGNLLGIRSDESEAQLRTFGMIAVELESSNGKSLQLAPNSKAQLKFPAPSSLNPEATIPLWYFDEIDGVWLEEGLATLNDGVYEAEVSHFSFWNCDDPYDLIELEGRLVFAGNPIPNIGVKITLDDGAVGYANTDAEGVFRGKVPKDELLTFSVRHCGQTVVNEEIGSFSTDTKLEDIDVSLLAFHSFVQGRLLDCFDQPSENSYGLLRSGDEVVQVITPISDGNFTIAVTGCANNDYSVQFYDPENLRNTEIIDISEEFEFNDLMDIRICEGFDEFIQYTIDGEEQQIKKFPDVYFSNGNKLIIRAYDPNNGGNFNMDLFATEKGDYSPSSMNIDNSFFGDPSQGVNCGDHIGNIFSCDEFNVNISRFDEYIEGSFSGILAAFQDTFYAITELEEFSVQGIFKVKIDEQITTGEIGGQFWIDENNNNIREDNETKPLGYYGATLIRKSGSQTYLYPTNPPGFKRFYKHTNVLPGTYEVRVSSSHGYEAVESNIGGDDDRDSDFEVLMNGRFVSNEITITSNEIFDNIDIGFKLPDYIECYDIESYGCAPDLLVLTRVTGGVLPYTAKINGEQEMEFDNDPIFNVGFGGQYQIEVEDAIGNKCSVQGFLEDYTNEIYGYVWQDVEGGTPNILDSGDNRLDDVPVILYNEMGELVQEILTNNSGYYKFTNVAPGFYYLTMKYLDNQFVEQDLNNDNGSDINHSTGFSELFFVENCNSNIRIDAGFKSN